MAEEATNQGDIDDIVPLGDFVLDDSAWDAIDGEFLNGLLLGDVGPDDDTLGRHTNREVPTVSSEAVGSRSRGSTDGSQHHDGNAPRTKRARAEDNAEEKLEKLRNRNRIAQARRRQRQRVCSSPLCLHPSWQHDMSESSVAARLSTCTPHLQC